MSSSDHESLATLLSTEQRGELSILIGTTTERMRENIVRGFEKKKSPSNAKGSSQAVSAAKALSQDSELQSTQAHTHSVPSDSIAAPQPPQTQEKVQSDPNKFQQLSASAFSHFDSWRQHPQPSESDAATKLLQARGKELSDPTKLQQLKASALSHFDSWRDGVVLRVGEVVNSRDHAEQPKEKAHAQKVAHHGFFISQPKHSTGEYQESIDKAFSNLYPPESTSLASLSIGERETILNSILLLLLSLESYTAYSRTLILRLSSSLQISSAKVTKMETDIAHGLLTAAEHMDGSSSTAAAQKAHENSRRWKVGLASVAGAALIGVTGGLAAPVVAAGVGGLMGGLGLGATAAAGYLGTLAGSGVLVGSLFGAYGGRMTGHMMDKYAKEVQDFAFLPVKGSEKNAEAAKQRRRLRVTVGISGWLNNEKEVVTPWQVLGDGGEAFALRWELQPLLALGNALQNFVQSYAWGYVKKELIKRTLFAGLWSALMLPFGVLKICQLVDNPFTLAKTRADKAGEVLADAIINKAQGERPVSLIGYSLGARVIYSCLITLAQRKAFGLIDSVVLMGAPTPSDTAGWQTIRSVVSGRLVNVFSENDYILAFLYRTSSVQLGIAGLQAVEGVEGVENMDVSDKVPGHLKYKLMVGSLLAKVCYVDLDEGAIEVEWLLLKKEMAKEEEERHEVEEDGHPNDMKLEEDMKKLELGDGGKVGHGMFHHD